jgi:transcriptional regulator with XRE-family HTH domain
MPTPVRNTRLRDARAKRGLTQPALARRARLAIGTINQAETGRRIPTVVTQERIARVLGVSRDYLWPNGWPEVREREEATA